MKIGKYILKLKLFFFLLITSFFSNNAFSENYHYQPHFKILTPFISNSGNGSIQLQLNLKSGYKAYIKAFRLTAKPWLLFSAPKVNPTYHIQDPFSKMTKAVTSGKSTLSFTYENIKDWPKDLKKIPLYIKYQICTKTVCYLKQTKKLYITVKHLIAPINKASNVLKSTALSNNNAFICDTHFFSFQCFRQLDENILLKKMNSILTSKNWGVLLIILFITGLLMSFTPCILPMIPITLGIIGIQEHKSLKQKLLTTLAYSLGISLTYAFMGVLAALTGSLFGSVLANPYVQFIFALIFFISAMSLFGLFSINGPLNIFQKYSFKKSTNILTVFLSGLVAGLIASPCIGPVLLGVLSFVATSQDALLGFALLFVLAQGLTFSLIIVSLTGGSWIKKYLQKPKIMQGSKIILGIGFLLGSFYFSYPLLSPLINKVNPNVSKGHKLWSPYSSSAFQVALKNNKPIVLDFYADWCLSCLELNAKVFGSKAIQEIKSQFTWLQIDATHENPMVLQLQKKYNVLGLPTVLFFSKTGVLQNQLRLTGFENAKKVKKRLIKLLNKK
ncbi:MAG: thioredoxin fold domain-containing protein [Bdellovibrionaceae bacterium]|nr:thioredoxin fold domain-containing protein [Pseudobdellovibrionaceae bacterium]